jgi:hypothetical protein
MIVWVERPVMPASRSQLTSVEKPIWLAKLEALCVPPATFAPNSVSALNCTLMPRDWRVGCRPPQSSNSRSTGAASTASVGGSSAGGVRSWPVPLPVRKLGLSNSPGGASGAWSSARTGVANRAAQAANNVALAARWSLRRRLACFAESDGTSMIGFSHINVQCQRHPRHGPKPQKRRYWRRQAPSPRRASGPRSSGRFTPRSDSM